MRFLLEQLLRGNEQLPRWCKSAVDRWKTILKSATNVNELAADIGGQQTWFEQDCGGRYLGQDIMAFTAIAQFYSTETGGNREHAERMLKAIEQSNCSGEIKGVSREVFELYFRDDEL
jgi:hypothetical protein